MDVAVPADGPEDPEMARREAGEPEERQAGREVEEVRLLGERSCGRPEALGRARHPDAVPEPAPELGLPMGRAFVAGTTDRRAGAVALPQARGPADHHVRAVDGVAVVEVGDSADGGEPPELAVGRIGAPWRG